MKGTLRRAVGGVLALVAPLVLAQVDADRLAAAVREGRVIVYAATDERVARPLIRDFEALHPGVRVEYYDMNSAEVYQRFLDEAATGDGPDVTWSSAMDLQVKLVNDGHAQPHHSAETAALPDWAVWKNEAFGSTYEPIAIVYNRRLLAESDVPRSHAEFTRLLVEQRERFRGKVATYDPVGSGLGFLLHSQDVQATGGAFWQLASAMGKVSVRRHTQTSDMLEQIGSGAALVGYNMLGSYAAAKAQTDPAIGVVLPRDYTLVLSRVVFIAREARHPAAAKLWVDHLLSRRGQAVLAEHAGLFSVREELAGLAVASELRQQLGGAFRPIAIGPGLLTYLDQVKRRDFLRRWDAAMQGE